uniref:BAR domain-containing protein n=1 Tax=Mola mola TaxID=94237 RepID=A0A3Q3VZM7_MOLML
VSVCLDSVCRQKTHTSTSSADTPSFCIQIYVEQRVEPAKKAAQVLHKKLQGCMQSHLGLETEKRMKKLPLMMLSISMAESLKDFDADSAIRVLEMCCFMEKMLASMLADFEMKVEKDVLEPLNKLTSAGSSVQKQQRDRCTHPGVHQHATENRHERGGTAEGALSDQYMPVLSVSQDLYLPVHFLTKLLFTICAYRCSVTLRIFFRPGSES